MKKQSFINIGALVLTLIVLAFVFSQKTPAGEEEETYTLNINVEMTGLSLDQAVDVIKKIDDETSKAGRSSSYKLERENVTYGWNWNTETVPLITPVRNMSKVQTILDSTNMSKDKL